MALAETWCHMKKKTLEEGGETRANTDVESCGLEYLAACFLYFSIAGSMQKDSSF
jgi:hypothetical protein